MLDFFKAIRLPNVILVALAQMLILGQCDCFNFENILLVILTSLWIMWGNIDNDIKDLELDSNFKNKPNNEFIQWLNKKSRALLLEQNLLVLSISISLFISIKAVLLTILAWSCLKFYNLYFKKMPLIGNLVIAFLCMASLHVFHFDKTMDLNIVSILIFSSTLLRELVKDKEDEKADKACGYKTIAIICEPFVFKTILFCLGIFTSYLAYLYLHNYHFIFIGYLIMQLWQMYYIYFEKWNRASLLIKLQILLGVIMIGFI